MSEKVTGYHSNDYGTIFITNQRVIGLPPLLGSFASKPLDVHERIANVDGRIWVKALVSYCSLTPSDTQCVMA